MYSAVTDVACDARSLFNGRELLWIPSPSSTSCLLLVMRDRYGCLPPFTLCLFDAQLLFNKQELMDTPALLYVVSLTCDAQSLWMPSPSMSCLLLVTHDLFNGQESLLWIPPPSSMSCLLLVTRDLFNGQELLWIPPPPLHRVSYL